MSLRLHIGRPGARKGTTSTIGRIVHLALLAYIAFTGMLVSGVRVASAETLYDYPQTYLYGREAASIRTTIDRCRLICTQTAGCEGFDHSSRNDMCRLYNVVNSATSDTMSTAGTRRLLPNYRDPINPPAPAAEEESWFFARFGSIDLYGYDFDRRGISTGSEAICASRCDADRACRAYTYNGVSDQCFLKTGFLFAQRVNGADAGLYFKSRPSEANKYLKIEWELYLSTDIPGSDLYQSPAQTFEQCVSDCKADPACTGYTWVPKRKRNWCFLKQGYAFRYQKTRSAGIVSARKVSENVVPSSIIPVPSRD